MAQYVVYIAEGDEEPAARRDLDMRDDQGAVDWASLRAGPDRTLEVWQNTRLVRRIARPATAAGRTQR